MKIVFLNIWNARRTEQVRDFFLDLRDSVDVICIQEAFEQAQNVCEEVFKDYKKHTAIKTLNDLEDFRLATYINNSFKIIDNKTLLANETDAGLALNIQITANGETLNICNVHGKSRPGDKLDTQGRIKQSKVIAEYTKSSNGKTIIGGDFNLSKNTDSIKLFSSYGFSNLIENYNIPTTRNQLAWNVYPTNPQLYADYVFTDPTVNIKNFEVVNNLVSDHLPMILEIL